MSEFITSRNKIFGKTSGGIVTAIRCDSDGKLIFSSFYKGYYADETALTTAYPTGENGWSAILGSTDSVWVWDGDTSAWVDSGITTLFKTETITLKINGGGYAITTGIKKPYTEIPFDCTITKARIYSSESTTTTVDIILSSYADYDAGATHPVAGDKITASAPITLSAGVKSEDTTLTGWTTSLLKTDIITANVLTNNNSQNLTIVLEVVRN